jgi:hypothetical protein
MVVFGLFNGLLETFLFFTCFKLGEWLAGKVTQNKFALFFAGLICFMIYSGIAHSQFWMHEFPQHLGTTPDKLVFRQFFFPVQFSLAISWALIYFIYRDFWTVVFIHIYIDMCVIYSIHYSILFR